MPLLPVMLLPLFMLKVLPLALCLLGVLLLLLRLGVRPVHRPPLCVLRNGRRGGSHIPHPLQEWQTQIREQETVRNEEASGAAVARGLPERGTPMMGASDRGQTIALQLPLHRLPHLT